ncbi:hypothetical protein [Mesorhizobium japonicum]|uniref:hypothetical protein n=1 Tax=Mesorhizobium japonicum TaxID=2066070 RepID=UPI0005C842E5|nr:hypothetical protein [Mesorhizobium japonicum]
MRQSQRVALAKRLDALAPGLNRQFSKRLSRDQLAFLEAFNITLGMLSDPVAKYAYSLTADGAALIEKLFELMASVDAISPTDTPENALGKWRDWVG